MTEESERGSVPGASAGDAAPTQAIPRIPKPPVDAKAPAAKKANPAPAKANPAPAPAPAKPPAAKKSSPAEPAAPASAQTDKGRPRKPVAETATQPAPSTAPAAKPEPDRKRLMQPIGGPVGRPLTAADYQQTTKGSPDSTSVIPAVKDRPADRRPSGPSAAVATAASSQAASGRRASLRLTHVEPWSVTRLAFAISVAMMIVAVVAVAIFWFVLDAVGVWDQINDSFTTVLSDDTASFNVTDYFGLGRVVGLTLVLSAVNVVLATALATIAAHLYNLAAQLMGGIEVTLSEDR